MPKKNIRSAEAMETGRAQEAEESFASDGWSDPQEILYVTQSQHWVRGDLSDEVREEIVKSSHKVHLYALFVTIFKQELLEYIGILKPQRTRFP